MTIEISTYNNITIREKKIIIKKKIHNILTILREIIHLSFVLGIDNRKRKIISKHIKYDSQYKIIIIILLLFIAKPFNSELT